MPRKPATPEQRLELRRRIRQAAEEVYVEKGLQGVSARAIAKRAGVSPGTLYLHFENLEDLMRSLWTEPVARANERLERIAKSRRDPLRRIRALLEAYVAFARENPMVYRRVILFVRPETQPSPERRPLSEFPIHALLCEAIREGQERGQIRAGNPRPMAQVLWASLHGALGLPINVDGAAFDPPEKLARATIRLLLRAIEA